MTGDSGSLTALHDIVLPAQVAFWPPGTAGIMVLCGLFLCLLLAGLHYYARRRKNRYRRAGLELLGKAQTVGEVSITLKRVALAGFARERVASLYGQEWVDFLNSSYGRKGFNLHFFDSPDKQPNLILLDSARLWIISHRTGDQADKE